LQSTTTTLHATTLLALVVALVFTPSTTAFSAPAAHSVLFRPQCIGMKCRATISRDSSRLLSKKSYESHHLFPDFFPEVGISPKDRALLVAMSAAVVAAFAALLSVSGVGAWRYFLAGGICAATSHAITTPIDVVKVSSCMLVEHLHCIASLLTDHMHTPLPLRRENKWTRHFETLPLWKQHQRL
jgi:hypothetical protein